MTDSFQFRTEIETDDAAIRQGNDAGVSQRRQSDAGDRLFESLLVS
jgi:hypothetical protein